MWGEYSGSQAVAAGRFLGRRSWLDVEDRVRMGVFGMVEKGETGEEGEKAGRIGCWRELVVEVVMQLGCDGGLFTGGRSHEAGSRSAGGEERA